MSLMQALYIGDFHGDFCAKSPIITVRFGKYWCVLVHFGFSMDHL